jgi:hypothetical protein
MRLPRFVSNTRAAFLVAALVGLVTAAAASNVFAQTVGTVTLVQGTATVQGAPAAVGMPVHLHDQITTGAGSALTIGMVGGSAMSLGANSRLSIDNSGVYGGTPAASQVGLLAGHLHTLIAGAMQGGTPSFEVHTPNAVGAVRGTEWDTDYEEGTPKDNNHPDCRQITEVWVESGVVHVSNPAVAGDPGKDVGQGQYVIVPCGYIPAYGAAAAGGGFGTAATLGTLGAIAAGAAIAGGVVAATSGGSSSSQPPSAAK